MIYEKLSPKQEKAMLWWAQKDSKKYDAIVCDGSVRSGKTVGLLAKINQNVELSQLDRNHVVARELAYSTTKINHNLSAT